MKPLAKKKARAISHGMGSPKALKNKGKKKKIRKERGCRGGVRMRWRVGKGVRMGKEVYRIKGEEPRVASAIL